MADPRFYDNRGPFTLAEVCAKAEVAVPEGADGSAKILDVASLTGAVAEHLSFFAGERAKEEFAQTAAGFCFVPVKMRGPVDPPARTVTIPSASALHAFAAAATLFYPDAHRTAPLAAGVDPTAKIGERVVIGPGVVVGPGAEIGDGTHLGPNTVVCRGVTIGCDCEISGNSMIAFAHLGDQVLMLPGAQIGQPGFGFASSAQGHVKVPQLGRVVIQDKVEIGACVTVDRGALGDTVIGEGTKIDNLVQIGHNTHIGRHCIIVGLVGLAGSATLGDFVVLGAQAGVADHAKVGSGARLAGRTGAIPGQELEGGKDYGGVPAKPIKDWMREVHAVASLIKKPKRSSND
jgi:UDP-3-O-[3-hydroxymyristoyl] glucosamine N-acyltransferase